MGRGFEDSEPTDKSCAKWTARSGRVRIILPPGSGGLQVVLFTLCLGNVLGNQSWLRLKPGQSWCSNLSSMDNQLVRYSPFHIATAPVAL